jgi:hypothetical protein
MERRHRRSVVAPDADADSRHLGRVLQPLEDVDVVVGVAVLACRRDHLAQPDLVEGIACQRLGIAHEEPIDLGVGQRRQDGEAAGADAKRPAVAGIEGQDLDWEGALAAIEADDVVARADDEIDRVLGLPGDPEQAAASFRAMLRENRRMALWTVHKHPIAFGEPTGIEKPGLQWKDVRELVTRGGAKDALPTPPPSRSIDPVLAGERKRIREQTIRARAGQTGKRTPAAIGRSLARLANRLDSETPDDAEAAKDAAYVREVARGLKAADAPTRDQAQDEGRRIEMAKKDPAALYKELEDRLRRRDKVHGTQRVRDRGDGGPQR